jgi:alanine racemase
MKNELGMPFSWLEIDLSALEANYRLVKRIAGGRKKIMAVVKADAYGHGLIPVAERLARCGVDYLAVASIAEAIELRRNGIRKPILLLNAVLPAQIEVLLKYAITATVSDFQQAKLLNSKTKSLGRLLKVHIEVDTGMGRYGLASGQAISAVKRITLLAHLDVEGIFTHFPCSDTDVKFSRQQIKVFKNLLQSLKKQGISFRLTHAANSAAIVNGLGLEFDMLRPGLMLYGLAWNKKISQSLNLKPVMNFKTRILFLKRVLAGTSISYGRTYRAPGKRVIATLGVGYADGYNRLLSNRSEVLIRGRRANVVGIVCMDNIMVDVTSIRSVKLGDEVVLFGQKDGARIYVEDIAAICKTIPYEVVCAAAKCVDRFYIT